MPPVVAPGPPPQTDLGEYAGRLGRIKDEPDPRDFRAVRLFALAAALGEPVRRLKHRVWLPPRTILDQGATSSCVAHAIAARYLGHPDPHRTLPFDRFELYRQAQEYRDEWPGSERTEPRYEGTSVRGGLEAARLGWLRTVDGAAEPALPVVHSYWRLFGLDQALDYLLNASYLAGGPLVLGTNWSDGMWATDAQGFLRYDPRRVRGGHAWYVYGGNPERNVVYCQNSWGAGFGVKGRFKLRLFGADGLEALLADDGDAFAVVEIRSAAATAAQMAAVIERDRRPG